jgi:hypothetical protein
MPATEEEYQRSWLGIALGIVKPSRPESYKPLIELNLPLIGDILGYEFPSAVPA